MNSGVDSRVNSSMDSRVNSSVDSRVNTGINYNEQNEQIIINRRRNRTDSMVFPIVIREYKNKLKIIEENLKISMENGENEKIAKYEKDKEMYSLYIEAYQKKLITVNNELLN
jgi:hypothetical protein